MSRSLISISFICLLTAGCSSEDIPQSVPEVTYGRFGAEVERNVALDQNGNPIWMQKLVSGYAQPDDRDAPKKYEFLEPLSDCSFTLNKEGAKAVFIHTYESITAAPVYAITKSTINKRAEKLVKEWRQAGRNPGADVNTDDDILRFSDVVVTDTSAPLYLLLASKERMVWNIVAAPGVKIQRVALLSEGHAAGIINLDPEIPVEAATSSAMARCNLYPHRKPTEKWRIMTALRADPYDRSNLKIVQSLSNSYSVFAGWYQKVFGADPEQAAIGGSRVNAFLVGPAPLQKETRILYKGLKGSYLRITPSDNVVFGTRKTYLAKNEPLVQQAASVLVGGDLTILNKR